MSGKLVGCKPNEGLEILPNLGSYNCYSIGHANILVRLVGARTNTSLDFITEKPRSPQEAPNTFAPPSVPYQTVWPKASRTKQFRLEQ
jgi:hypothetical protein